MLPKPKPIRRTAFGIISRTNVPYDEPLTPGLRKPQRIEAIGFTAGHDANAAGEHDVRIKGRRD